MVQSYCYSNRRLGDFTKNVEGEIMGLKECSVEMVEVKKKKITLNVL